MKKEKRFVVTQEELDKIIPPAQSKEEAIKMSLKYEEEYIKSKQKILDIMKRNAELYKNK